MQTWGIEQVLREFNVLFEVMCWYNIYEEETKIEGYMEMFFELK